MASPAPKLGLMTPNDLNKIAADQVSTEIEKDMALRRKREEAQKKLYDDFKARDIRPDAMDRINTALRNAVSQGQSELLVLQFPSDWCTDGGRGINNDDPNWTDTLDGFAKRAYSHFVAHMQPLGYKLRARIIDYPGGKPGDVGLFVSW
jgi:hypothetical protein